MQIRHVILVRTAVLNSDTYLETRRATSGF